MVSVGALLDAVGDWADFLGAEPDATALDSLRLHERTGRPLGSEAFVAGLEAALGRQLRPKKPGRKPAAQGKTMEGPKPRGGSGRTKARFGTKDRGTVGHSRAMRMVSPDS